MFYSCPSYCEQTTCCHSPALNHGSPTVFLPALCTKSAENILIAEKPVFGASVTLHEKCFSNRLTKVSANETLGWLAHETCENLFLRGLPASPKTYFSFDNLVLQATQTLCVVRCEHLRMPGALFCFSAIPMSPPEAK